jgi:predicted transcriptional regulator of viral defense system
MVDSRRNYGYLEDFLTEVRSQGRYAFALDEVKERFQMSDKAINQALYRLKAKKRIAQIRKGFYAILSPEYLKQGMVPPVLFIDDMMKSIGKRYYAGLLSAASLHGAAHQQPMEFFVVTEKPALRAIKSKNLKINFYVKKAWPENEIMQIKTDAGYVNVSTPELTALDLLYYLPSIGISRTFTILEELVTVLKAPSLARTAASYPQTSAIQRLGFLLECQLDESKLAAALSKVLADRNYFTVPLSLNNQEEGDLNNKWKVIKNIELESEL